MNYKFVISYDGSCYSGSQTQPHGNCVEDELLRVFKYLNIKSKIYLSGRTDKNVHATGQVFNCELPVYWHNIDKLKKALNKNLNSIKIKKINLVKNDFHSRFSAKKRTYRYLLTKKDLTPFNYKYITKISCINEELIKKAINEFVGVHDFKFFQKLGSDKEVTIREIYEVKFYKYKDIYVMKFVANSYLRSQIRLMVNFLLNISNEKLSIENLKQQLKCKKQYLKNPAKPNGLYLAKVFY